MSAVHIAILDDYQGVALTFADWTLVTEKNGQMKVFRDTLDDEDLLAQRLKSYKIICSMRERTRFPASLLDKLPNLRLLTTTGLQNAAIDIEYAKKKGITVCGTGGAGNSTLEHIWALLLATVRHLVIEDNNIKTGQWQTKIPFGLSGRTLGIIGVGRLGSQTAQIAKAFGMRVIAWSPNLTEERAASAGVELVSKESIFEQSDVVSIHIVLSERTRHLIGRPELSRMKPTAFLINTSRGPIVEENALLEALKKGQIAGAGLDVFDKEPLPSDHPLRQLSNVTLSPHNGYVNDINYKAFWEQTVENIIAFLDGEPKRTL